MVDRIRVFLALNLSPETRKNLDRIVAGFPVQNPVQNVVKWVGYENYHLTLKFIGPFDPARLDALYDAVSKSVATCRIPRFSVQGLGLFSRRGIPSVVWAGVTEQVVTEKGVIEKGGKVTGDARSSLTVIHEAIETNLNTREFQKGNKGSKGNMEKKSKRSPSPHITLGRIRAKPRNDFSKNRISGSRIPGNWISGTWISEIRDFLRVHEGRFFGEEAISGVSVMQSQLGPSGAKYHELERILFPG